MAVGYRSSSNTGANDQFVSSLPVPVPAGAAAGDIALVAVGRWKDSGSFTAITPPAGFTLAISHASTAGTGVGNQIEVYWKRLTGADGGNYTFTWSGSRWSTGTAMLVTGGIASGDPVEATNGATGTSTANVPNTSVTVATAAFLGHFIGNANTATQSVVPTGFTNVQNQNYAKANYRIPGAPGTHSASGGTLSASQDQMVAALVAVKPAEAGSAFGQSTETDTAQIIRPQRVKTLVAPSETDTAQAFTLARRYGFNVAASTETAQPITPAKRRTIIQALEADTAQPFLTIAVKVVVVGQAIETDTATPLTRVKTRSFLQAVETDTAQAVTSTSGKFVILGQAVETSTAQGFARIKVRHLGRASESNLSHPIVNPTPRWRLIPAVRTDTWAIDQRRQMGPTFSISTPLTIWGDDSGLQAAEAPASEVLDAAEYVFYGGYDHITEDRDLRDLWLASGFEVEQVAHVEV